MGRFAKHIGLGKKITIKGDEIHLKPLGLKYLPDIFELMGKFEGAKEDEMMNKMDRESAELISKLCRETMALSYPNEPESERDLFVMQHIGDIFPVVIEINSFGAENKNALKERMEQMKSATKTDTKPKTV